MRPRATEIVDLFLNIANDTASHPSTLNERARRLARTLSNLTPSCDRDGKFEERACAYVVITAAASAYERASFLFKYQREVETYNALEWARGKISGLDGRAYRAHRELEDAWDALFAPAQPETITLVRSNHAAVTSSGLKTSGGDAVCELCNRINPPSDCCGITGDEYGTPS